MRDGALSQEEAPWRACPTISVAAGELQSPRWSKLKLQGSELVGLEPPSACSGRGEGGTPRRGLSDGMSTNTMGGRRARVSSQKAAKGAKCVAGGMDGLLV